MTETPYLIPRIVLNDGTVLINGQCGYTDHKLWCYLQNVSFSEAYQMFYANPEKTATIRFFYGWTEEVYHGFTDLSILKQSEMSFDVRLTGEHTSYERIDHTPRRRKENDELHDDGGQSDGGSDPEGNGEA